MNGGLIMGIIHGASGGIYEEAGGEANHVIFDAHEEELLGIFSKAKAKHFIFGRPRRRSRAFSRRRRLATWHTGFGVSS